MVARRSQEGMDASRSALAVSRLPRAAHEPTPTAPARLLGIGTSRHHQACWGSYTAAQLRHPSPRAEDRYSDHQVGRLEFFGDQAALAKPARFKAYVAALQKVEWVVYAKRPFGGPDAVLAYLSRYTHRVAIANSRLLAFDGERVTFKWKDYRAKADARYKLMTLDAD